MTTATAAISPERLERIRQAFEAKEWSKRTLANKIGYSSQHVTNFMLGNDGVTLRFVQAAEKALDIEEAA